MPKNFDATLKGMLERGPADWPALLGFRGNPVEIMDSFRICWEELLRWKNP
jgi:hypothetical protein